MCGIAGTIGDRWSESQFASLFDSISHRGPDSSGIHQSGNFRLGMNRLHIRGEANRLPYCNEGCVAAFNGQIYGVYPDGKKHVTLAGSLESEIAAVHEWPSARINGMYACASAGKFGEDLMLQTDFQFIKPLFYRVDSNDVAFCSEFVPLVEIGGADGIDQDGLAELFVYGWYLGDQTYKSSIRMVCSSDLSFRDGKPIELPKSSPYAELSPDNPAVDLRNRIRGAVRLCLTGRGPFGLAISGGLDSSILAWELNAAGVENLTTISIVMAGTGDGLNALEELNLPAGGVWETWSHHTVVVGSDWNFLEAFESSVRMFGHPTNMSSLPLFQLIAEIAARNGVRVLLSGEGVDEFFAGYGSYRTMSERGGMTNYYRHPPRLALIRNLFGEDVLRAAQARFMEYFGTAKDLRSIENRLRLSRLLLRTDVCLMSQSIEGRVPFLHNQIPDLALSIPWEKHVSGNGKALMREAYGKEMTQRARVKKTRFKLPDQVLRDLLFKSVVLDRVISAASRVFGVSNTRTVLKTLASENGFDADVCCLLLSLTFLIEDGLAL